MRPASSRVVTLWISVLCLLTALTLSGFASAQASSKHKLSKQSAHPVRAAKQGSPKLTADNWTGSAGDNNWGTAGNWSAGVPTSSDAVTIGTTTANVNINVAASAGSLTLSGSGDTATIENGENLTVSGNIVNNGTLNIDSTSTYAQLVIGAASVTLSGTGTLNLNGTAQYGYIDASTNGNTLINQSTITGWGNFGDNGSLTISNAGTVNANNNGNILYLEPYYTGSVSETNSGTLEATGGGILEFNNAATWNNTGTGTISAGTGSAVYLDAGVTINGGNFATSGTGWIYGDNATISGATITSGSQFEVQNGGSTTLAGNLTNNGTLTLDSTSTYTDLIINASNVTLSGSGTLVLGGGDIYDQVAADTNGDILTNEITITGQGTIGEGSLVLNNSGTINANVSGANLTLSPYTGAASTNSGTLEATGGGGLLLSNGTWTNTGTISAGTGSAVYLENGVTINGGTLSTSGTGWIYGDVGGSTLSGVTLSSGSQFEVLNGQTTDLIGTITNKGTMTLGSTSTYTIFDVPSGTTTLTGGGTLVMGAGAQYSEITGASGAAFVNSNNTIEGYGNIGEGALTLTNNGTINANTSPTVINTPLYVQSANTMTNTSIMEATNGGDLDIYGTNLTNSGSGAVIEALGADGSGNPSYVVLYGGSVTGGTLTTTGAGVIYGEDNAELINVTNTGNFQVPNGQLVELSGTLTNNGTVTLGSTSTYTSLVLEANTTLTGSGTLVMGAGDVYAQIYGNNSTTTYLLTNNSTIEGDGCISCGGYIGFTNNSVVNANVSGETLNIDPATAAATNTKTLEATNGGQLELQGGSWTNTGGTITAATGSDVYLNGTTINGGTLSTSGTGVVYGDASSELIGVTNTGNFQVQNGQSTNLSGTITNSGTITLASTSTYTNLYLAASTTLSGGGTVVLGAGDVYAQIYGVVGTTLTNSNNTIEGYGCISCGGYIYFVNNATVNANVSGETLNLDEAGTITGTNTKTMEATNGGQLELQGTWTNTGGTITAASSSDVYLNGATITGGTLTTSGSGATAGVVYADTNTELIGLTNSGNLTVQNNNSLYTSGTITNNGTITLQSTSTYTNLILAANTTLSGKGTLVMGDGAQYSQIYGEDGDTLTNSGNTIEGYGCLGCSNITFDNSSGTVNANISGGTLAIQSYSSGPGTTNNGTFEATNGGVLNVVGTLTNYSSGTNTLTGGTYTANGAGSTIYLPLGSSGGISTLSASVTEENGGLILNSNNSNNNALNGLTSITSTGSLTIGSVAFTDSGSFSNAGSLTLLSGESFNVGSLTQISGTTLTAGTYVLDANLGITGTAQTITTNAANLTLAGGTIENTSNSTNALAGLASNTGKLTIGGTSNSVSTTATSFSNTGTLTINAGDSFTASKLTQINSSHTLSAGTYVLAGNLDLTTTGITVTTNSANLTLEGGTIKSGSANALAGLAANTAELTIAGTGKNVSTTASSFSNTGTLTIDKGDSFTAGNLTQISSGTLTGGTYVLAGNLDLTTSGITVTTNSANLTLEGGTINSNGVNALSALAANTGELTIGGTSTSVSTTAASFSNTGTLTIDKGDSFTAPALTQISGTTLTAGTYVLAGNLDLTGAANITTNSAVLTLEGGTIQTGTTNDLANLNNNSGTFTLASNASFTTVGGFTNTGTVDVEKGSTLTVSGTGNSYSQTAGTTTIDGTLAGIAGGATVTGGTILGAGTVNGNVSVGNATGTAATINVGDTGKAGLLSITGTYTQLATGTITGFINGTTVGTGYSQLKVTGTAALGGTINFTVSASFQPSLTVGEKFTVLTASSVTGTFTNSTIAINATLQFDVSYTATGVVLTVADVTPSAPGSGTGKPATPIAHNAARGESAAVFSSGLRDPRVSGAQGTAMQPILARGTELSDLRSWERVPGVSTIAKPIALGDYAGAGHSVGPHNNIATPNMWVGEGHGAQSTLAGWAGTSGTHRVPVKIMSPALPRMMR